MVCENSARSASIGGVAANHSSLSDPFELFGYPSASISRAFVDVNPSCSQERLACPLPALSNRHFIGHVHLVVILHVKLPGFLDFLRV